MFSDVYDVTRNNLLEAKGTVTREAIRMAIGQVADYRRFIRGSKAEFGIAKSGYVASRCGWFSDRSLCYLASGRPVLAQETGFSHFIPAGEGLFAFESVDDILDGIEELRANYARHARAARDIAEEFFDSEKVLSRLLNCLYST